MSGLTAGESFLKSILSVFISSSAVGSITKTMTLGSATPLVDRPCKAVILLNACSFFTGNGDTIAITSSLVLPCNNASEINVSGSGTLNYIILL